MAFFTDENGFILRRLFSDSVFYGNVKWFVARSVRIVPRKDFAFLRLIMRVLDFGLPCLFLRRQVAFHADQHFNPLRHVRPGNRDLRAASFTQSQTFCVVILLTEIRAGECMTVAASTVLLL